jgi:hypothetical protein
LTGTFNSGARVVQALSSSSGSSVGQFNATYANNSVSLVSQPLLLLANLSNNVYTDTQGYGTYSCVMRSYDLGDLARVFTRVS